MPTPRTARQGDKVRVHYRGRLEDGSEFDTSVGREPFVFVIGSGDVIPGFEDAATGMSVGEMRTVTIGAEQAYGPHREDLVLEMPWEFFPEDIVPEVGMELKLVDEGGEEIPVVVADVGEAAVMLDANHPLAGHSLTFDIELLEIVGD